MSNLNLGDLIQSHIAASMALMFTALPAKVESYDPETRTVSAQPVIRRIYSDGVSSDAPLIDDIPVMFPSGGGAEITMPVKKGDLVLLVFSMRNIQDWLVSDGQQLVTPSMKRNHSQQDAIAIPGLFTTKTARKASDSSIEIVLGQSKVEVQDSKIIVESGTVELGEGATESAVLGDSLKSWLEGHKHEYLNQGVPAFTTVPRTSLTPAPIVDTFDGVSSKVKVK